ncbi:serine hydrolase domain-containing protein [Streptomyces sp. NPDC126514]|uniref:serine hydrolase domain-containing protein n=1 Tax=Streptomyces sp. NPDC126514 TaxID=3155210 RepID=UPI00331CBF18
MTGFVAAGYEAVAWSFTRAVAADGGRGAQFVAYVDGAPVVRLCSGECGHHALLPTFSGAKGILAFCMALLTERNQIALDEPVATYWPEFAQAGKGEIRVWQVLSHQAGVPFVRQRTTLTEFHDVDLMTARLAEQHPAWPPGQEICYHAMTYGWIVGELIRRADGRSPARFIQEEIAEPLAADVWQGVPMNEMHRVVDVHRHPHYGADSFTRILDPNLKELWNHIYNNPPILVGCEPYWNSTHCRFIGGPGVGIFATAEGMVRAYACLVNGGKVQGGRLLCAETVDRFTVTVRTGKDAITGRPLSFGLGFELPDGLAGAYGPPAVSFGHSGAGGFVYGCWPQWHAAFGYTSTLMRTDGDPRARDILIALHASLKSLRSARKGPAARSYMTP